MMIYLRQSYWIYRTFCPHLFFSHAYFFVEFDFLKLSDFIFFSKDYLNFLVKNVCQHSSYCKNMLILSHRSSFHITRTQPESFKDKHIGTTKKQWWFVPKRKGEVPHQTIKNLPFRTEQKSMRKRGMGRSFIIVT